MAKLLKLRRGSSTQHSSFTGAEGEVTVDTDKDTLVVHDGSTTGGRPLLREDMSNLPAGTIDNADVNTSAAIDGTKVNPNFGSQNISTTGNISGNALTLNNNSLIINGTEPKISFVDSNANPDYEIKINGGVFDIRDSTADASRFSISATGETTSQLKLNCQAGLDTDGDVKFNSGTTNVNVLFDASTSNMQFSDSMSASFGSHSTTGDYSHVYVNGGDYTINAMSGGSGDLIIGRYENAAQKKHIVSTRAGVAELYHDNSKKLNTATGGVEVTGNLTTTGTLDVSSNAAIFGDLTISDTNPILNFTDTNNNSDFRIQVESGSFLIEDTTNSGADRFVIDSNGTVSVAGNLDVGAGVDVSGNITVTGTVDGVDLANLNLTVATLSSVNGSLANGVTATTQSAGDNSTKVATTAYTDTAISNLVDSSPSALNTLNELAAALGDDANFSTTVNNNIATKMPKSGGTFTGDATFSGGAGAITVSGGSDIRFDDNTSWTGEDSGKIQFYSNGWYFQASASHHFRNSSGTNVCVIDSSGNLTANGNITAYSDARLKTDISTINDALGICGKLRGVSYKWLKDDTAGIGVIAQEVEKVLPEVVFTHDLTDPATGETTEVKSVNYGTIVGVLINAINELKAEVDELKGGK